MSRSSLLPASLLALSFLSLSVAAHHAAAADAPPAVPRLLIQDHRFIPVELHVPANRPVVLEVENRDDAVEEFESYDLDREQRVRPGETGRVRLAPLPPGRYPFFGDFHRKTAQGVLVVD